MARMEIMRKEDKKEEEKKKKKKALCPPCDFPCSLWALHNGLAI